MKQRIVNVAVIAHVDAGKSTLVDAFLEQSGTFGDREERVEQIMDSDDLERERGITIYSKNCAIDYKGVKINVVDTPGHADFSGEVERIMKNVDTVILLVDSSEGPMPQTRFVLQKSLDQGLKPILLINKIDKDDARPEEVVDMTLELFMELDATDEQLEFPILYGSTKNGIMKKKMTDDSTTLEPLFETLLDHVETYKYDGSEEVQMQITSLKYDNYLGRIGTGRLIKGTLDAKDKYSWIKASNGDVSTVGFSKVFVNKGLERDEVQTAQAGDIVSISGVADITIGDTISTVENPQGLPKIFIEEPTLSMNFLVNKSPFAGQEGKWVTSRNLRERLDKELETNVSLKINELSGDDEGFQVQGRGELHLSVLIENMRREGFELAVSKPKVIYKTDVSGRKEPFEEAVVTCAEEYSGAVIQQISERKGTLLDMMPGSQTRMIFEVPTRGLIGYRQTFITTTRGTGILEKTFKEYQPYAGEIESRKNGVLVSTEKGEAMAYSLWKISERGDLFITPQTKVYQGMVIGINSRAQDMDVNPIKNKQMTNTRSSGADEAVRVPRPIIFSLEEALEFIEPDELVEVTPENIRLRKKVLDKRYRHQEKY